MEDLNLAIVNPKKVSGGNQLSVETGENHEKNVFKSSKKFSQKMNYVGKVEFYIHGNLQVETQNGLEAMKMTNSTMNSTSGMNSNICYYS